jgi:hypothetical protein
MKITLLKYILFPKNTHNKTLSIGIVIKTSPTNNPNQIKPSIQKPPSLLDTIRTKTYAEALKGVNTPNPTQSDKNMTLTSLQKGKHTNTIIQNPIHNIIHPSNSNNNQHERPTPTPFNIPTIIKNILKHQQEPLQPTPWSFDRTQEAATRNSILLHSLDFNVERATQNPINTILSYGSEFRPTEVIKPLLKYHPQWTEVEYIINHGANYPLRPITEKDRLEDIQYMINRGNHQSTKPIENQAALNKAFDKEIQAHWAIPLNPAVIPMIPGASITPLRVATQWTVDPQNNRIKKRRVTHDCTFPGTSGNSCNHRVIPEHTQPTPIQSYSNEQDRHGRSIQKNTCINVISSNMHYSCRRYSLPTCAPPFWFLTSPFNFQHH